MTDREVVALFRRMDDLMGSGRFEEVDREIEALEPEKMDDMGIIAWMTCAAWPKRIERGEKLTSRPAFLKRCRAVIEARHGDDPKKVHGLLLGLED